MRENKLFRHTHKTYGPQLAAGKEKNLMLLLFLFSTTLLVPEAIKLAFSLA